MIKAFLSSLLLLLLACAPSLADDWCIGKDAVPADDGTYRFSYQSWIRARANAFMYGRCIEVLDPTEKLRNHWEGVLPEAIARKGRPTVGGQGFVDKVNENRTATLHYGNSDSKIDAAYFAHKGEPSRAASEAKDPSFRKTIEDAIKETGGFLLESIYSFSTQLVASDDESTLDIDASFSSKFDGTTFNYVLDYTLNAPSPKYAETTLTVRFDGEALDQLNRISEKRWIMAPGKGQLSFTAAATAANQADFVDYDISLVDQDGRSIATLPISYLLPAAN
ncbi:hypothetical protein [Mesorhizobium sp. INR15]|uniref:hypothetical protein n=1 Tax=Mesorhizobium sp. INR15 TaxID=2654248 RepID=UPI00189649E4|nr:hypothetical protein [Mesorhizobium sp. INR15]QPC91255.1 hypothetical protein GA829_11945 [Mesorhizobium sp. INR15]